MQPKPQSLTPFGSSASGEVRIFYPLAVVRRGIVTYSFNRYGNGRTAVIVGVRVCVAPNDKQQLEPAGRKRAARRADSGAAKCPD